MTLAASTVSPTPAAKHSPHQLGAPAGRLRRPQFPQRGAAHTDAGRLPLLGQDRGAPAHLVGRAHRRRAAGIPRHGRRAVARLPHRLLSDPAADGTGGLRLLAVPAGDRAGDLYPGLLGRGVSALRHRHPPRAPLSPLAHALAWHPRRPVGALAGIRLDLPVDHAARACDARLDPAVACGATAAGALQRDTLRRQRRSPSPASPGRSTGASGWCGSAASSCSSSHRWPLSPSSVSTCRAPARNAPTMRALTRREDRGHDCRRARRLADLRHDPRLVQLAHAELLRRPHQAPGHRLHAPGDGAQPGVARRQQLSHSPSVAGLPVARSPRRAPCATSSTGFPATAPSPGARSVRTRTSC